MLLPVERTKLIEVQQANTNCISTLKDLEPQLGKTKTLETIYLEGNPCQRAEGVNYRRKVMLALPQVTQIDATYVWLKKRRLMLTMRQIRETNLTTVFIVLVHCRTHPFSMYTI